MVMDKKSQLDEIAQKICGNQNSPLHGSSRCVPGEGNPDAIIFFAGEAPGFHEAKLGRPFVGQAGKLLEELLTSIGLAREEVFIGNCVHFRPPENRDPTPAEVEAEKPFLLEQIKVVNPKIIATLGRFALNVFISSAKISRDHGQVYRVGERVLVPLYHPAAALRAGTVLAELKKDFEKLGKLYQMETGQIKPCVVEPKEVAEQIQKDEQMKLL